MLNNWIYITSKKKENKLLHFLGKSPLDGRFVYEILLDKINKDIPLIYQLNCSSSNIITDNISIDLHVGISNMKNSINIFDPYNYKNYEIK